MRILLGKRSTKSDTNVRIVLGPGDCPKHENLSIRRNVPASLECLDRLPAGFSSPPPPPLPYRDFFHHLCRCTTKCDMYSDKDKVLIEKRRSLWMQLVQRNLNGNTSNHFVCSHYFVSGSLGQANQLLSLPTGCSLENGNETVQHESETQQDETSESTTFDLGNIIEDTSVNVDIVEDSYCLNTLSQESTSSTEDIQPGTSSFLQLGINCQQSPCRDGEQKEIQRLKDAVEEIILPVQLRTFPRFMGDDLRMCTSLLIKKHLAVVNDESFCNLLKPGDEVFADRGFLIKKHIEESGAKLTTTAFFGKRSRLTRRETSFSRKVSNLRIHVERVIGRLRETYKITKDYLAQPTQRNLQQLADCFFHFFFSLQQFLFYRMCTTNFQLFSLIRYRSCGIRE
ncbi:Uncharacterized protein APZ42_034532 [Daphnia magna]|uniref:DDE Tnp4 domain-containing protein n=1 Tax=Daphnia magna TaxID=35525 RepID=A0A162CAF2_9CRUS|nr:Uncharacterized protein APZ42_034532 [Daphnia magna]